MDGNYKPYDYLKSSERIKGILNQPAGTFEEVDGLPDREKLTYTNGFYGMCSAIFIDIRDSSGPLRVPDHRYDVPSAAARRNDIIRRESRMAPGLLDRWHRAIETLDATAGLAYGFKVLKLRTIWAEAVDANTASVAILRRIGMRETGRGPESECMGIHSFYRQFEINDAEFTADTA